jgi:hypothetical protein
MGFLSRKKKNREPAVLEETHPLEEELQGMEEAVPERAVNDYEPEFVDLEQDDIDVSAPTAGPVPDEGSSSSQAAGEDPSSAPPADDAVPVDAQPPAAAVEEEEPEAVEPDAVAPAPAPLRVEEALNAEGKDDDTMHRIRDEVLAMIRSEKN